MLKRLGKIWRWTLRILIIAAFVLAYHNYRYEINDAFPVEDLGVDAWYSFKGFIAQFAVVPEYERRAVAKPQEIVQEVKKEEPEIVLPEIKQSFVARQKWFDEEIVYGYDAELNLVSVEREHKKILFYYAQDGFLESIVAPDRAVEFHRNERGELTKIIDKSKETQIKYDFYGRPSKVDFSDGETLAFEFDGFNRLLKFRRGAGIPVVFFYRDNKLVSFTKASVVTELSFNAAGLLKGVLTGDDHLVVNYGRDNLLSYFAGSKYGLGETVSYNTNDVSLVSNKDNAVFSGDPEPVRFKAFNLYLGCTKFKRIPVVFDPLAYVLFENYFKEDVVGYLVNNYVCEVVFDRDF